MSNIRPLFENFDADLEKDGEKSSARDDTQMQELKAQAYEDGFKAGTAAAKSRRESDDGYLKAICASLEAQNDVFQKQITADFCRILGAAIEKILPAMASAGFERDAIRFVHEAIERQRENGFTLEVAPHRQEVIREAFSDLIAAGTIKIKCDEALGDLQIVARWETSAYDYNIQEAIDQYLLSLRDAERKLTKENEK